MEGNFVKIEEMESVDFNLFNQRKKIEKLGVSGGNNVVFYDNGEFLRLEDFRLDKKKYPNGIVFEDGKRLFIRKTMRVVTFGNNCFHVYPSPVPELIKTDNGYGFLCREVEEKYFEKAKKKTAMHIADFNNGLLFQVIISDFGPAKINFNPLEKEENVLLIDKKGTQRGIFYRAPSGQEKLFKLDSKPFPINRLTKFCLSNLTDKAIILEKSH